MTGTKSFRSFALLALVAASPVVRAADPYPQPQPYPDQQYPQTQYPQAQYPQQSFQQTGAERHPMRALFASSLAQVTQTTGSAAVVMLADSLTGALKGWFDNRRQRKSTLGGGNAYAPYPSPGAAPGSSPGVSPDPGYPSTSYPQTNYPAPATDSGSYPTPGSDGYPQPENYPTPASAPSQLYAGIAYEIHLLQPDGTSQSVDPATYSFRSGDQFRVYYRPSLPGRVDVFNINAAGQQSQIDSSVVAAGELATLGPYEFTLLQGQETLILKLTPCSTPNTYVVTRNIVKAQGAPGGNATNTLGFSDCSSTATRGLRTKTRDIRKVSVEGGTSFALDPIAPAELGGGDMSPRQITISLMHR